ncbi:hypothetical protein [Pseudolysinimonas sp.]|uniref:hypothetical protein n=1 Tax=Pseudolysinimonas sp. TaxID=2680009 RepID=UPI0032660834
MTRSTRVIAALGALMVACSLLVGCTPTVGPYVPTIVASADGVEVTVANPAYEAAAGEAALEVYSGSYLMGRPFEITASGALPASGVQLAVEFEKPLPTGVTAVFAYFDENYAVWVPVPTQIANASITATVDHLSLWSVILGGPIAFVTTIADQVAHVVEDPQKWWEDEAWPWLFRTSHELLGNSAEAPECESKPPPWVESVTSTIDDALYNSVLACADTDPDDPEQLRVRAAANRGFGYPIELGGAVTPTAIAPSGWDAEDLEWIDTLLEWSASVGVPSDDVLDPRRFIWAGGESTILISKQAAAAIPAGEHLVSFPLPNVSHALGSSLVHIVLGDAVSALDGFVALSIMLRECQSVVDAANAIRLTDPMAAFGSVADCLAAISMDRVEVLVADFLQSAGADFEARGADLVVEVLAVVISKLKFSAVFQAFQTATDYLLETTVDSPLWFLDATLDPSAFPRWEDINGEWCSSESINNCYTIALPTSSYGEDVTLSESASGCFLGTSVNPVYGSGANILYCPAGVATPTTGGTPMEALTETTGDNIAFDRIFVWQGFGAAANFRRAEIGEATGR